MDRQSVSNSGVGPSAGTQVGLHCETNPYVFVQQDPKTLVAQALEKGCQSGPALTELVRGPATYVAEPTTHTECLSHLFALIAAIPHWHVPLVLVHLHTHVSLVILSCSLECAIFRLSSR